nr:hypothetical protein [Tanacetum cinerariifolium]
MSNYRVFCCPCTCERCRRNYTDKFCSICCFESRNAFIDELTANYFDDLLNSSDHPPQHQTHSFESYNDNPNYGYPPQEPFVYNQDPRYEQNFVDNSQSPPKPQYETYAYELCRNDAHYGYDCPPQVLANEDIKLEMAKMIKNNRILLNDNIFPHEEASMEVLLAKERILKLIQAWDEKQIESWSLSALLLQLLNDSLTIDEMLKKCEQAVNLVVQQKQEEQDVSMEDFKVYSNSLFDNEEINSNMIDPRYSNAKSDLIESLSNQDTLFDSSHKFDYLEDFSSELMLTSIIDEEIDIFTGTDDLMPLCIESGDYRKGIFNFLKNYLAMILLPFPKMSHLTLIIMMIRHFLVLLRNHRMLRFSSSLIQNRPAFYDDDDDEYSIQVSEKSPIAITPVLSTKEPKNSLSMGDEHLDTIPETESDKVIKSSVEDLVPILSESEGILDSMCDVPFSDKNHFGFESDLIESLLTQDTLIVYSPNIDSLLEEFDDSFKDIDYVEASPLDSEFVSLEEVKDEILRAKLLNIHLFIAKIESLNNNLTPDCVLKSPSLSFLSYSDKSLPEFETFSDHMKETGSGSTTTHADNSFPEYDSFLFEIELDQGELSSVAIEAILGEPRIYVHNVLPTHPTLYQDSDFSSSDDSLGSGLEVSFPFRTKNKIFDSGIFIKVQSERLLSWEEFFISFICDPLYPVFKPGILSYLLVSHRDKTTFDFFEKPMMMYGGDSPLLDGSYLHFYPP